MLTEERVYVFVWNTVGQGQTETAMTVKKTWDTIGCFIHLWPWPNSYAWDEPTPKTSWLYSMKYSQLLGRVYIHIHTYTVGDTSRPRNALRVGPALLRKHAGPAVKSSPGPSPAHGHTERINPGGRNMVVKYSTYVGSNMISIDIHNINIYLYTEIIILWVLGIMC